MPPEIRIFDGQTGKQVPGAEGDFLAYGSDFAGGVFVAAGDITGDSHPDIITGPGAGGGATVKIFSGVNAALVSSFAAYGSDFQSGVHVAAFQQQTGSIVKIVTAPGSGAAPVVHVWDGLTGEQISGPLGSFLAYEASFEGGVYVATGDVNADGQMDLITGPGAGRAPEVKVFSGVDGAVSRDFLAFNPSYSGGVRVASAFVNDDAYADIVTAEASTGEGQVRVFSGSTGRTLAAAQGKYQPFSAPTGGIFVAGANDPTDPTSTATPLNQETTTSDFAQLTINATLAGGYIGVADYYVIWGDGVTDSLPANFSGAYPLSYTFTHNYTTAGTYTAITVTLFYRFIPPYNIPVTASWAVPTTVIVTAPPPPEIPDSPPPSCGTGGFGGPGAAGGFGGPGGLGSSFNLSSLAQTRSANSGNLPPTMTLYPVRYNDGVAQITASDLVSNGFGFTWGQQRTWSNGVGYARPVLQWQRLGRYPNALSDRD
jgi:hypothetical protein